MPAPEAPPDTTALLRQLELQLRETLPDAGIEVYVPTAVDWLRLALINADYQTGPLPQEVMHAVIARPAYWAFCWGSGLALARWLAQHPEAVAGKRVADLGSGCGIGAVAAVMQGAASVWACDNDQHALQATAANAALNGLTTEDVQLVDDLAKLPDVDVLLMADVLYDRSNYPLVAAAKHKCQQMIIADSRIDTLADPEFEEFAMLDALTLPNLGEFDEFKNVRFFRWSATAGVH